jgi:hypothetical protein
LEQNTDIPADILAKIKIDKKEKKLNEAYNRMLVDEKNLHPKPLYVQPTINITKKLLKSENLFNKIAGLLLAT